MFMYVAFRLLRLPLCGEVREREKGRKTERERERARKREREL